MREYYLTYNSADPESLMQFYHPDVELHSANGVLRGRDEIMATYRYLIATFHDQMEPCRISADGNIVTVDIVDRLTARTDVDDFLGSPINAGETLTLELRGIYQIEDGQFRHISITSR